MRNCILFVVIATAIASAEIIYEGQSAKLAQLEDDKLIENLLSAEDNSSLVDRLSKYLKTSDIAFGIPVIGSKIILDARNFKNDELNLKLDFSSSDGGVEARKKSKIKKIFVPILVFILLKAMVLVPLALGILGIKTWNAIQLSFISFVSALVLAVWKLCSKVNHDHPPAIVHTAWDPYHHDRSDASQQMAYSSYAPS